ncbi:hypothetical protein FKM82_015999 [Ascaphus truei]
MSAFHVLGLCLHQTDMSSKSSPQPVLYVMGLAVIFSQSPMTLAILPLLRDPSPQRLCC